VRGSGRGWTAVLPVKRLPQAKTRLRGAVAAVAHEELVVAMALDTIAAVLACPLIGQALVVTGDPDAGTALAGLGAIWVPDEPAGGINAALTHGAARAGVLARPGVPAQPALLAGVVALTADLPALRPAELSAALQAAARLAGAGSFRGYVPDAGGTGTVLLAALGGAPLAPAFGAGSAQAHAASGAVRLDGDWPSLRCDVDTADDLAVAAGLGLGPHAAALVEATRYGGRQ